MTAPARTTKSTGLSLVVDAKRRRRPRLRGWMVFSILVVGAFLLLIYSRIALDGSAFVIEDLESQIADEETRYWELRLQVAELQSPERVIRAAEGLGLVYPDARVPLEAPGVQAPGSDIEQRWAELKALLSAQR